MLLQEKSSRAGKKRQQKQAAAANADSKDNAATEGYRESLPVPSDSKTMASSFPSKVADAVSKGSAAANSVGAGNGQPGGQLLGGFEDSDSGASSATSLASGFPGDEAAAPTAGLGGNWEPLADTACTRTDAPVSPPAELALPSNTQYPGAPAELQHPGALPGRAPRELNPMDRITGASLPARNLLSDTCISRDADTLTMNAGENTEFPEGQGEMQACHPLLASGQPSSRPRRVCSIPPMLAYLSRIWKGYCI